jgi:cation diffusion facilitator CzcD-associated flavoprotein CzcO
MRFRPSNYKDGRGVEPAPRLTHRTADANFAVRANKRDGGKSCAGLTRERPAVDWRNTSPPNLRYVGETWLAALGGMLAERDISRVPALMHPDGYWRDLLTFGWEFKTLHGVDQIQAWLDNARAANTARNFCIDGEPFVGAIGEHSETLQFFFTFETLIGRGRGFVRLVPDCGTATAKAFTLLTTTQQLKDFPEAVGRNRAHEDMRATSCEMENWLDRRRAAREFKKHDPDVVIIGAGQSGLMLAARLEQLKISTLLVERSERIGDVWRKRYSSLKLHNDLCMNHFPYMPFPETWPVYLPKDKLADWLEFYAESMELNVWTATTFLNGEFDPSDKRWTVRLQQADGRTRIMRPRFVVLAVGVSGLPSMPTFPGMDEFSGAIVHSSGAIDDLAFAGRKVLVVGAGTSAHDIAQHMYLRGADVTMLQRSSVTVVNLEPSAVRAYQMYRDYEGVRPIADIDLIGASVPYAVLAKLHGPLSRSMAEADKDLLDGLRNVGFLLDNGEDDTGYFLKLLRYQAGYYLNIGASELIVAGKIKLKSGVGIARLTPRSAVFSDGSALDTDIIVFGTGYEPAQEAVRAMFGDEVADRVGPIWGIGATGELCAMYAPTGQEGFFVVGGGFPAARAYSIYTALYMKAALTGLLPSLTSPAPAAKPADKASAPELHHA